MKKPWKRKEDPYMSSFFYPPIFEKKAQKVSTAYFTLTTHCDRDIESVCKYRLYPGLKKKNA